MNRLPGHFWPKVEASRQTGFSRNPIERRSEHRTPRIVGDAFEDPQAKALFFDSEEQLVFVPDRSPWLGRKEWSALQQASEADPILLGWINETPCLALQTTLSMDELPSPYQARPVRSLYSEGVLSPEDEGAAGQARSLLTWHKNHHFCSTCGAPAKMDGGGTKRVCTQCEKQFFPRIDPVAIMLVTDGERALLGRGVHFPEGMYSCLAGFVEQGETAEDTVRREVFEESGIKIGAVRYHASQPWPMPHSLMMGFFAEALSTDIVFDETELADCRWFDRDEVADILSRRSNSSSETPRPGEPSAPPRGAIAQRLMTDWVSLTA
ncbi:NAD(+) diphosphatase [Notoacmeibacter ruber]|uniref:NAD(+) diphosphatase n=1 Tax=Notoacmeibacter ruber TaxID=2670375 RepID=A0A3L7J8I2_9HYPH|nr:NAD(+) diphosphatase [Notoacmeibacter ruber]RLQ87047.1 NAD(+) diphosphatase [Notoacmeibacter ruber]